MRLRDIASPIRFVDSKRFWDSPDRGKIDLIDQRGLNWSFVLQAESTPEGLRLHWWPSTTKEGDDVARRIEIYSEKYGDIGVSRALGKALQAAFARFAKVHPAENVFRIPTGAAHIDVSSGWDEFAAKLGFRVEHGPGEIKLRRLGG